MGTYACIAASESPASTWAHMHVFIGQGGGLEVDGVMGGEGVRVRICATVAHVHVHDIHGTCTRACACAGYAA